MESSQTKIAGRTRVAGDSFHTSQGKKVRLQVSQFLGAEFVFVGRHGSGLEDGEFTVQLIDEQERLLSLSKANLREFTVLKSTPMPSYKDKFSSQELADLEAYLLSLRGVK